MVTHDNGHNLEQAQPVLDLFKTISTESLDKSQYRTYLAIHTDREQIEPDYKEKKNKADRPAWTIIRPELHQELQCQRIRGR